MSGLARRGDGAVFGLGGRRDGLEYRGARRAAGRAADVARGRGLVLAAEVRSIEYVTQEALQAVNHLSYLEACYARQLPHATARFQTLVDLAAINMANIVAEAGR